ncbi:MAG: hypothetical protein Q8Q09_21620 [Deltaproteobacteria bacterium]|nr:hypothetical protein [Deltaproteobacteria bacterium]
MSWPDAVTVRQKNPSDLWVLWLDGASDQLVVQSLDTHAPAHARVALGDDPVGSDGLSAIRLDRARGRVIVALAPPLSPHPPGPHGQHPQVPQEAQLLSLSLDTLRALYVARTEPFSSVISRTYADSLWLSSVDFLAASDGSRPRGDRVGVISVFDPATLTRTAQHRVCMVPHDVVLTPERAYIACLGEDQLITLALASGEVSRTSVGDSPGVFPSVRYAPRHLALDAVRQRLWVTLQSERALLSLDLRGGSMRPRARLAHRGIALAPVLLLDGELAVATREPPSLFIVRGDSIAETLPIDPSECSVPVALEQSADGRVWLLCENTDRSGAMLSVRLSPTARIEDRWELAGVPRAMALWGPTR